MTAFARDMVLRNADNASFRQSVINVRTALTDIGLVRTADTGQINETAVVAPVSVNLSGGYDIFRFNDSLQATRPIFIKVEYGLGATGSSWQMWFTVGTSTDGAGTINSGLQTARRSLSSGGNSTPATNQATYWSGDGSFANMLLPTSTLVALLSIERTRDANGAINSDGILMVTKALSGTTTYTLDVISFLNQYSATTGGDSAAVPGTAFGTTATGGDVFYFPRLVFLPKLDYDLALMFAYTGDVVNLTQYSLMNCGALHTYMSWTGAGNTVIGGQTTGFSVLMRFE